MAFVGCAVVECKNYGCENQEPSATAKAVKRIQTLLQSSHEENKIAAAEEVRLNVLCTHITTLQQMQVQNWTDATVSTIASSPCVQRCCEHHNAHLLPYCNRHVSVNFLSSFKILCCSCSSSN